MDCTVARVAIAAIGAALALAGCASGNGSPTTASISGPANHIWFHEPRTPKDAAAEFVRAMMASQNQLMDRLTCLDRPTWGSRPLILASRGSDTPMRFQVTRVRRTLRATWRVTVTVRGRQDTVDLFHVDTTVEHSGGHYRVCTAQSR